MPYVIAGGNGQGLTVPHQMGGAWCWAACAYAVIRYFRPHWNDLPTQQDIVNRYHLPGGESGHPARALKAFKCHWETKTSDGTAVKQAEIMKDIRASIDAMHPVILFLSQQANNDFRHAVVVYGYDGDDYIYCKDPALQNPDVDTHTIHISDALTAWYIYPQFPTIAVYIRELIYTNVPLG